MAHDASHYLLIPQGVATPRNADDVGLLLRRSEPRSAIAEQCFAEARGLFQAS